MLLRMGVYVCRKKEHSGAETCERGVCRAPGRSTGGVKMMEKAIVQLPDWEHAVLDGKIIDSEEAEHILIKGPASIPANSFCLFDKLKSVEIADDVLGIDEYSFRYCQSLKSVQFGKGIQFIGRESFRGCRSIETLTIPGNIRVIGDGVCQELASLKSLTIEEGVQTIDWYAFSKCGELENVVLPKEGIKKVGGFTFTDSKWIKNNPNDCVIVGDTFIRYCGGDTDYLKIPDNVREVAAGSLGYFTTIREIDFGKNVKRIAGHIFRGDTGLKRIILPEGLEEIGAEAFLGCYGLRNVSIPDSVLRVGTNAFRPEQLVDCPTRGCVYVGRALMSFVGDSKKVVIREGTYSISYGTFYRKYKLELVVLPKSIREIRGAFDSCTHLSTIVIPRGVPSSCLKDFTKMDNIKFITYQGSEADEYAKEKSIAVEYIDENMPWEEVARKVTSENGLKDKDVNPVETIPKELRPAQLYEKQIEQDPKTIYKVPQSYRSASLCRKYLEAKHYSSAAEAIKDDENICGLLNPAMLDHDACMAIVQTKNFDKAVKNTMWLSDPLKLTYGSVQLKKLLRFPDVSLQAVKKCPNLLEYTPETGIDDAVIQAVADSDCGLRYIPEQYKTKEMCDRVFNRDPWSLSDIPDQFKTTEMCLTAVKRSGFLLKHVPDELKTTEMCKIAVKDDGRGTPDVPERLYDKELAELVLKHPGSEVFPLKIIPKQFLDYDMCKYAVTNIWGSLKDVPEEYKDYDLCLCAVKNDPLAVRFVPVEFFTPDIVLATSKRWDAFQYIPDEKKTEEACLEYAQNGEIYDGYEITKYIPSNFISKKICDALFQRMIRAIMWFPDEYVTEEMLIRVAKDAPGLLSQKFPERLKTEELCRKLIEINPAVEKYI